MICNKFKDQKDQEKSSNTKYAQKAGYSGEQNTQSKQMHPSPCQQQFMFSPEEFGEVDYRGNMVEELHRNHSDYQISHNRAGLGRSNFPQNLWSCQSEQHPSEKDAMPYYRNFRSNNDYQDDEINFARANFVIPNSTRRGIGDLAFQAENGHSILRHQFDSQLPNESMFVPFR